MKGTLDITAAQHTLLLDLLRQYIPEVEVWAYGSRVKGTARTHSDLDLVVFTTSAHSQKVPELREALAESDLPFVVDLHVWDDLPKHFHEGIRRESVVVTPGPAHAASA